MADDVPDLDACIRRRILEIAASFSAPEGDPQVADAMLQLLAGRGFNPEFPLQDMTVPAFHEVVWRLGYYVHRQQGRLDECGLYFLDTLFCRSATDFHGELTLYGLVPSGRFEQLLNGMTPKGFVL